MRGVILKTDQAQISREIIGNECWVFFQGDIDEDFEYSILMDEKVPSYHIDLERVHMMNSCGYRELIAFLENIDRDAKVTYHNCPQVVVQQFNMLSGLIAKNTEVRSFIAPYFCESCDMEVLKKIELSNFPCPNFEVPKSTCPKCKSQLEFDALEKSYLKFLSGKI